MSGNGQNRTIPATVKKLFNLYSLNSLSKRLKSKISKLIESRHQMLVLKKYSMQLIKTD